MAAGAGVGDKGPRVKPEDDEEDFAIGITDALTEATAEAAAVPAFAAADLAASAIDLPAGARIGVTFDGAAGVLFTVAVALLYRVPAFCEADTAGDTADFAARAAAAPA